MVLNKGLLLLWVFSLSFDNIDAGQNCASCSALERPDLCEHHIVCDNDEKCYTHQYNTESGQSLFDLGCTAANACPHSLESVFGRRAEGHHYKCMSCCNDTSLCNLHLTCDGTSNTGVTLPRDCSELVTGSKQNRSYVIFPYGVQHRPVAVYCVFDPTGLAWTVIQRRYDGSVNFTRDWAEYKRGFGYSTGEYWLGLETIHQLTSTKTKELKVVLTDFSGGLKYADFSSFRIADENHGYRITIFGYSGNAGDSMTRHDGMMFSTVDRDNDVDRGNCAAVNDGGWWYRGCHMANLNGLYMSATQSVKGNQGIQWETWHGNNYSLKSAMMMVRSN